VLSSRTHGTGTAPWQSRTFAAAGLNPTLASASAVNSCDVVAGGANAASLLADKLVVADLGTAGFKVVGDLVIIFRSAAEQRL
jgi:hypothetical protein